MKFPKLIFSVSLLLTCQALGQADESKADWQDSIVLLDVTRNNFNFRIPWDKRAQSVSKFGAVIEDKELKVALRALGFNPTKDEIKSLISLNIRPNRI